MRYAEGREGTVRQVEGRKDTVHIALLSIM